MTTTSPPLARSRPDPGPVGTLAGREIARLQRGYLDDRSDAVAALARLRRAAGKDTASVPDLWGLIDLDPLYADPDLRHDAAANAVDTTLALWSLHQQSRPTGMHRPGGDELGSAVRRLMPVNEIDEPVRKRFVRAGTAPTLALLATRLRDITVLLRREDLALDYALLADQLYHWQQPGGPDRVRRSWGRSFHAAYRTTTTDTPAAVPAADIKDAS
ncbi:MULTISPECIES: type I-E CRISPR-associated protein Cse2/CasB [unclassified Streptomyces]|uniref:type I-E CRISPR-associated protein Cse2/CasB n=1 Tax=unclassified Streptomyces TaxID=2593676 RepID=UPI00035EEDAA|nr:MULTISPECIES: type I-E CRISPR-associated protein Cse2/CasB [unclassified Streptomyces]MYX39072.1 type I-E CRISPR-associated protein Cse2/CasB [Streptomyces sp. SID8377]